MGAHTKKEVRAADQQYDKTTLQNKWMSNIYQTVEYGTSKGYDQTAALHSNKPTAPTSPKLTLY